MTRVTKAYMGLQGVTRGDKGLQRAGNFDIRTRILSTGDCNVDISVQVITR